MSDNDVKPGWGATIGVYFGGLLLIGFITGIMSMIGLQAYGGYSVGGILSWLAALAPAAHYRSTGKAGAAFGVAVVIGFFMGIFVIAVGPAAIMGRYGA